jgi:hypothetical protein
MSVKLRKYKRFFHSIPCVRNRVVPWSRSVRERSAGGDAGPQRTPQNPTADQLSSKDGCHGYEEKEEGQEGCEEEVQLIWTNVAFIWNAALPSVFAKCPKTVFRQSGWTKVRPL